MRFIFAIVFFIASIFVAFGYRHDFSGMVTIGIATILGFVLGKVFELQRDLKALQQSLAEDWEARQAARHESNHKLADSSSSDQQTSADDLSSIDTAKEEAQNPQVANWQTKAISEMTTSANKKAQTRVEVSSSSSSFPATSTPTPTSTSTPILAIPKDNVLISTIKNYFTGGNLFVRVGIIILFFGVSFLLKYVSDQGIFPIEYRLIGVVVLAIALLGLGWRLRLKNETYALLLQGAGIGVLYLDIFAAFSLYHLIPSFAAFALLFIVSMFSAALAVLQDSKSLAVLGFSGGFLAPVLVSSGSNNHVGLFSYYVVLNLAIVVVAWFKAWRPLNLLGFAFTFIISTAWGFKSYNSDKFSTTEPFLIIFFLFYVVIAVLFALRQPPKLKGYVDGSLLFGVPLAASGLQYSLLKDTDYGVAISAFVMGAFYLFLSSFVLKRKGDTLKLLAEAFLVLGVIFASMAIPFALAPTQTAAAWALEGAGLLWLGSRQNRLSVRIFGLLLQFGGGLAFFFSIGPYYTAVISEVDIKPFINGQFLSTFMVAVGGIISARLLILPFKGRRAQESFMSSVLLIWGVLWLFGGFVYQLGQYYPERLFPSNLLLFTAVISFMFTMLAIRLKPEWKGAWLTASSLFGLIIFASLLQFAWTLFSYKNNYHPFQNNGWIAWPAVFGAYYFLLKQLENTQVLPRFKSVLHSLLLILLVVVMTFEGAWVLKKPLSMASDWLGIWLITPTLIALWMIIKAKFWPFTTHKEIYRQQTGIVFAAVLIIWSFIALGSKGSADPLPWIPLFNPLDIVALIVFMSLFKWWQTISDNFVQVKYLSTHLTEKKKSLTKRVFAIGIAGLIFLWLNFTLFRIAYHWFEVPYNFDALYQTNLVQSAVSILWALSGVILTIFASRKKIRFLWIAGAFLLGLVVVKLFIIDLSTLGSLARIISFMVVGILLTSIGYFAPLPDKEGEESIDKGIDKGNDVETNDRSDGGLKND